MTPEIGDSAFEQIGAAIVLAAAVLTALGVLARYLRRGVKRLWRFVQLSVRAFEIIEKELAPNGGGSTYDLVRQHSGQLVTLQARVAKVQETAEQATTAAALAVGEAKVAAAVAQETALERRGDVEGIRTAMGQMREEIAQDAAERTADAYELLAEHGGPDLRAHLPGAVAPHAHELPTRAAPALTGGPIETDETEDR